MPRKDTTKRVHHLHVIPPTRKTKPETESKEIGCRAPAGWLPGDKFFALHAIDETGAWCGLREGHTALIYRTNDVRPDDLTNIEVDGKPRLGYYRTAPGGYFTFEEDGEVSRFPPGTAVLIGRVIHFERLQIIYRQFRACR